MAGFFSRLAAQLTTARVAAKPYTEQGTAGFTSAGGYIVTAEKNAAVAGPNRWHTAQDLLTNVSIIAASVRYSLNLISRPAWRADPPSDKPEAKAMAEFVEEVINGADTSWARIVRRAAVYRYHGFNLQEWVAKKRDDGKIGIQSVEQRPAHTVRKWDLDDNGGVLGVVQASPQTGEEIYLPRRKLVYLVDDALTDSPEGLGWFRHLADPAQRLRRYLKLETMGFERDLNGIPVGRAPLQRINQLVEDKKLSQKQADAMIKSLEDFVRIAAKQPETGLLLDSEPFRAKTETGETVSSIMQWGLELITGSPGSMADLGNAIHRLMLDMAMIIGTDSLLIGQSSGGRSGGSRALSEDKSKALYLTSNAALSDMTEAMDRDIVTPLWAMNGFPDELRPHLKTEDVSFKDAEGIAQALANMATAGAILDPNDPAINDLRDLLGISAAPPVDEKTAALMFSAHAGVVQPAANDTGAGGSGGGRPSRENPDGGGGAQPNPKPGAGRANKFDPSEPRDDQGQWTDGGGGELPLVRDSKPVPSERYDGKIYTTVGSASQARAASEIDQHFTAEANLTPAEHDSLKWYSSDGYDDINDALRADSTGNHSLEIGQLDSAIAKEHANSPLTLYRGLGGRNTEAEDLPIGSIITDKAFSSTSADPSIGAKFASWAEERSDKAVLLRVHVPPGANALHLHPGRAVLGDEHEVILPRRSRMKITSAPSVEKFKVYGETRRVTVVDVDLLP
jgi:hypothetical protein